MKEPTITVEEACRVLRVSKSTLYRKIARGLLDLYEPGKVTTRSLDRHMTAQEGESVTMLRKEVANLRERVAELERIISQRSGVPPVMPSEEARTLLRKRHPELLG